MIKKVIIGIFILIALTIGITACVVSENPPPNIFSGDAEKVKVITFVFDEGEFNKNETEQGEIIEFEIENPELKDKIINKIMQRTVQVSDNYTDEFELMENSEMKIKYENGKTDKFFFSTDRERLIRRTEKEGNNRKCVFVKDQTIYELFYNVANSQWKKEDIDFLTATDGDKIYFDSFSIEPSSIRKNTKEGVLHFKNRQTMTVAFGEFDDYIIIYNDGGGAFLNDVALKCEKRKYPNAPEPSEPVIIKETNTWIDLKSPLEKTAKFYIGMSAKELIERLKVEKIEVLRDDPINNKYSDDGISYHHFGGKYIDTSSFEFQLDEEYKVKTIRCVFSNNPDENTFNIPNVEGGMSDKKIIEKFGKPMEVYSQDDVLGVLYDFGEYYIDFSFDIGAYPENAKENNPELYMFRIFKDKESSFYPIK